jgi:peptidoglycan/xylan/chitin deacetylase (PgdA/CDA1 family)
MLMKQNLHLTLALLLTLFAGSCTQKTQQSSNTTKTTTTEVGKPEAKAETAPNTPAQIIDKPQVPVLCYHRISEGNKSEYTVSPATFTAHIKVLADSGYHTISPDQLYDYLLYNKPLPEKPVMITFDDSRSEHFDIAAPLLEKSGFRGVFFIMTITYNKKNYMTKEQIGQLAKSGHTVGMHSWDHTMVPKYNTPDDWQKQVIAPKEKLESITGSRVDYWAYPNGVYDHKGAAELSKHFKLSFILSTKRDTLLPLQTVRRIIVPEWSAQGLLKAMRRTFK